MENIRSSHRVFALLCALFFLSACADIVPEPPVTIATPIDPNRTIRMELASHEPCEIRVITNEPGRDGDLSLFVSAESGIYIEDPSRQIPMYAGESREDLFRCQPDPNLVTLAGQYQVYVQADIQGIRLPIASTVLDIGFDGDMPIVLPSAESNWPNNMAFIPGSANIEYAFIASSDDPAFGYYVVKGYGAVGKSAPRLILETSSSVTFSNAPSPGVTWLSSHAVQVTFPPIDLNETRIAVVPVQSLPGVATGNFGMRVTHESQPGSPVEESPVGIAVSAENGIYHLSQYNYPATPVTSPPVGYPASDTAMRASTFIGGGEPIVWDVRGSQLSGTLEEVFKLSLTYDLGLTEADWQTFAAGASVHNPTLVDDGWIFLPEREYRLPRRPVIAE